MTNFLYYLSSVALFIFFVHLFYSLQFVTNNSKLFKLKPSTLYNNDVIQTPISSILRIHQLRAVGSFNGFILFNHLFIGVKDPSEIIFFAITSWRKLSYFSAYRSDNGLAVICMNITVSIMFKMPNATVDKMILQEKEEASKKEDSS